LAGVHRREKKEDETAGMSKKTVLKKGEKNRTTERQEKHKLTIDNHIPVPARAHKFVALDQLEVGQSTSFPNETLSSLCACMQYRQRRYGKKFTRRNEGDTVRVWRTE
jgi:hypothetical protein